MLKPIGLSLWVLMEKLYGGFLVNEWRNLQGSRVVPVTRAQRKKGFLSNPAMASTTENGGAFNIYNLVL
jgi:hypothetical protein